MFTQKKVRGILRWLHPPSLNCFHVQLRRMNPGHRLGVHIFSGLIILCYIYSPFSADVRFQVSVKFFVIPILTFSGLWIWKFTAFNKFFRIPA